MTFRRAASLQDLWSGEKVGVVVGGKKVLLVHAEDRIFAYEDTCAHLGVALSEGSLRGRVLACAAHGWEYDVTTGCGVNPKGAHLVSLAVRVEAGDIWVDVGGDEREEGGVAIRDELGGNGVGPVLQAGPPADAVVAAIRELNGPCVLVVDRGAYLRVLVPGRCVVTRREIERHTGSPFRLPADLELIMPSFKGRFEVSEDEARWSFVGGVGA